jgi:hypothetical protein
MGRHDLTPEQLARRDAIAEHVGRERRIRAEQFEQARLARDALARELGYPDFAYMLRTGLVNAVRDAPAYRARAAE